MSYRPSVPDSSRATPYFFQRNTYPIKTHRTSYFDIAQSALVTRKLGNYRPVWVKGMDAVSKGYRYYRNVSRKYPWLKKRYIPHYPWFSNGSSSKRKYKKLQVHRRSSRGFRGSGSTFVHPRFRYRQRFTRAKFCNRFCSTHRVKNKTVRFKGGFRKSRRY